jgi:hypothetical protein
MRELSFRSLLISHLAMFATFCLFLMVGHGAILTVLHVISGSDLSDLHERLKSDELFKDIESASALSLSAVVAGWFASKTSNTRPLVHGALSSAAFFLLFLCGTAYDLSRFPGIDLFRRQPLMSASELALPLFGVLGASLQLLRRRMPGRERGPNEKLAPIPIDLLGDLGPIASKWLVRLIWLGSIVTFEALEVIRYRSGQTYRPLFALLVAAIVASLIWQVTSGFRGRRERNAERAASGQLRSPLYIAANGLVVILIGLVLFIGHTHRDYGAVPSFLWIVVAVIIAALLLLRRALKWRYPYV